MISLQQICKLIEVIVYILVIKSHDVDIPDITVKFKTFNLISTFYTLINVPMYYFPLINCVEFYVYCSGWNDGTNYSTGFNAKKKICEKHQKIPKLLSI